MAQADLIREFVGTRYIESARAAGTKRVTVRAGDVQRDMKLKDRMRAVALTATAGPFAAPLTSVAGQRRVSGTVYTLTPSGKQPVSGASASLDLSDSDIQARSTTDVDGRFMLCGLPLDRPLQMLGISSLLHFSPNRVIRCSRPGGDADIELILK